MHVQIVFGLCIEYLYEASVFGARELAAIAYLSALLGIERRPRQYQLIIFLIFLLYLAVTNYFCFGKILVVTYK